MNFVSGGENLSFDKKPAFWTRSNATMPRRGNCSPKAEIINPVGRAIHKKTDLVSAFL
ncbi:MAG: hypothetical protein ACI92E_000300 [Oceanicoccus sp.]|jgi:hypothetical protein